MSELQLYTLCFKGKAKVKTETCCKSWNKSKSGELFDATSPDLEIKGLSSYILNGLMEAQKEKEYLVTTGYNRNMIRFNIR
jgi:hypothetical protein